MAVPSIIKTPFKGVFIISIVTTENQTGKGSGKPGFSRGGSIETERFQKAERVRFLRGGTKKHEKLPLGKFFVCCAVDDWIRKNRRLVELAVLLVSLPFSYRPLFF